MRPRSADIYALFLLFFMTWGGPLRHVLAQLEPPVTPPPRGGNSGDDDDEEGEAEGEEVPSTPATPYDPDKGQYTVNFLGSIEEAQSLMQRRNKKEAIVVYFGDRKYAREYPGAMATEEFQALQKETRAEFVRIDMNPASAGSNKLFTRILGLKSLPAVVTLDWDANPVRKTEGRNPRVDQIAAAAKDIVKERAKLEQRVADTVLAVRARIAQQDSTSKKVQAIYEFRFMTGFGAVKDARTVIDELNGICKREYNIVARECHLLQTTKPEHLKRLRELAADYWGTPMAGKIRAWLRDHEQAQAK